MYEYIDKVIEEEFNNLTPEQKALVNSYLSTIEQTRRKTLAEKIDATFGFEPPTRQKTSTVIANALLGMTIVLTTALSTAHISIGMLLAIPAYAIYLIIVLSIRQQRVNALPIGLTG